MSTATVTLPPVTTAPAPPSLARLVAVELRKSADTRSGRWLLAITALLGLGGVALIVGFSDGGRGVSFQELLLAAQVPVTLLLPVVGILLVTSEWSQRTALTTFTLVPQRSRVVVAKALAVTVLAVAAFLATVVAAALGTAVADVVWDGVPWSVGAGLVGRLLLLAVINTLAGYAFGLLLQHPAVAIVTFLVLPTVLSIVVFVVPALDGVGPWIDLGLGGTPFYEAAAPTGEQWAQLASVTAIWFALPLALGWLRASRREIS